jgi:lysophospholipase L1-like esterase
MRLPVALLAAVLTLAATEPARAGSPLPREPSQLLLIGDSITAGIYFLSLDEVTMRQAWSGQFLDRLGLAPSVAPYPFTYPIDHLRLAESSFVGGGVSYLWAGRRAFSRNGPGFAADNERVVLAIPGQTLEEMLTQSSLTKQHNKHSSGWTFANLFLPRGLTLIETVEQWSKRPDWVVLFAGSNDLLASLGIVGDARPPSPEVFETQYMEMVTRLRNRMAPDAPPNQLFVLTLPDVTRLPLLQPLPEGSYNGNGDRFPAGSQASAFLVPFRNRFEDREVWTPQELDTIRTRARNYNAVIRKIAAENDLTVIAIDDLMLELDQDSLFATPESPYFSPDLHHPSFRTHAIIANRVLERMSQLAGEPAPPGGRPETPLPDAGAFTGKHHTRVAAMMRIALLGLESGPLPPDLTTRLGVEAAGQAGDGRIGDATLSLLAGFELPPCPLGTFPVVRIGASLRAAALTFNGDNDEVAFFPQKSLEGRLGLGFEKIGAWTWTRVELGGLLTLDGTWDGGLYTRGEWRGLYAEVAGRGWWFDRVEAGIRFGVQPGRVGRTGN